jgi:TolA-binding protein
MRKRLMVWPVLMAALLPPAPVQAQVDSREGIALQNEIYGLRAQVQALQDQIGRGGAAPSYSAPSPQFSGGNDLVAQLLTRVDALEDQVRQLRGRVDELQNQLQQQNADLGKRIDDLAFQVNPNNAAPAAPPAPAAAPAPPAPPPPQHAADRTPEAALQSGYAALARHDYQAAEAAAREVLANRLSPRAYDANLLLAKALQGQRQYAQAAIAFDDTYNRSRKGAHAQDALVGLASSLSAINERKAACDTLDKLHAQFPQERPDVRQQASAAAQRAGCR